MHGVSQRRRAEENVFDARGVPEEAAYGLHRRDPNLLRSFAAKETLCSADRRIGFERLPIGDFKVDRRTFQAGQGTVQAETVASKFEDYFFQTACKAV